ncbi:MAG: hypothetical protein ACSHYB_00890 [Roseibacillus sp.]
MHSRLPIILLIAIFTGLWVTINSWPKLPLSSVFLSETPHPKPDPAKYRSLIGELATERQRLAAQHASADSTAEKELIENEARALLEAQLPQLMRCWLGTPWDFNGTSQTPGDGKIACGYFVSTVLRDAGFEVERFRLAQQASQNIIRTFLARDEIHISTSTTYEDFLQQVIARGPGVRIVGLDTHVAFLIVNPDQSINFIHSSGARPWTVVDEGPSQAAVLAASNYRVTGNLTENPKVIQQWLAQNPWPTKTS